MRIRIHIYSFVVQKTFTTETGIPQSKKIDILERRVMCEYRKKSKLKINTQVKK